MQRQLPAALAASGPLPPARLGRPSARVRHYAFTPQLEWRPDESGQRCLLTVTAGDRSGLLYGISRVLAAHGIGLELAKIATLGERVEDTFLLRSPRLADPRVQSQIERELLAVLSEGAE